jgi:hypothetical protein
MTLLWQKLALERQIDIALVKELCVHGSEISCLCCTEGTFSVEMQYHITVLLLLEFSDRLQDFLNHLSSQRTSIQFTVETEPDGTIPFLDNLVIRKGLALTTKVYRKSTHTGRYLHFDSNHPPHVKRGIVQCLQSTASTTCQEQEDILNEIGNLRCELHLNEYPKWFTD